MKFADNTTIISGKTLCAEWCTESNLLLNLYKTAELIVALSKSLELRLSQVNAFKFLGSNDTREPILAITHH